MTFTLTLMLPLVDLSNTRAKKILKNKVGKAMKRKWEKTDSVLWEFHELK